jgi:hypothetical protein
MSEPASKKSSNTIVYLVLGCIGLLIVVSCCICAVLTGASALGIGKAKEKVNALVVRTFYNSIEVELESIYDEKGRYPLSLNEVDLDSLTALDYSLHGSYIYIGDYTITYTPINNGQNYRLELEEPDGITLKYESTN